jgi:two-component system LytT family response regulator
VFSDRDPFRLTGVDRRLAGPALILGVWTLVAMVAAVQAIAFVRLEGRADMADAILSRLSIIPLWALGTPLILRSARRFRVVRLEGGVSPAAVALHLALGSLFVVLTNIFVRVPTALSPDGGVEWLVGSTTVGVAEYYPPAMVVYGVIVAIGHFVFPPNAGAAATAALAQLPPPSPDVMPAPPDDVADDAPATMSAVAPIDGHIVVRQWNRVHLVRVEDIDFVEAEDNYVVVHASSRTYKARDRISDLESQLDARRFVRIHRSTIVHVAKIREVQPLTHGDHAVVLRDGKVLRVARSRRDALAKALGVAL